SCKLQAASCKLQAASCKLQAASCKLQAASCKLQAASCKLQAASVISMKGAPKTLSSPLWLAIHASPLRAVAARR
ncbi:hypothetical protein, partial [Stutzerimonas kirkiae]|uniref:hypothetical protein n=1 Tax=Stutzerimonas kirkiae TaxID=2211392 RepID=UPI001A95618A